MKNLKLILIFDAFITGAVALLQVTAFKWLSPWLGLSETILLESGWILLGYTAFLGMMIRRESLMIKGIIPVIAINFLWAIGCGLVLATHTESLTPFGEAFVCVQIVSVLIFGGLQTKAAKELRMPLAAS